MPMGTAVFDTLAYAKKLREAGVPEKQAEVQAEALAEIADEKLATKDDIEKLKKDILLALAGSKTETIKWVAGMLVTQAIVVAALFKLIH